MVFSGAAPDAQEGLEAKIWVLRTGVSRTKTEIKRDFDYLARLWDEIRERTLGSAAPALIHSDSDLIKRAIQRVGGRLAPHRLSQGQTHASQPGNFQRRTRRRTTGRQRPQPPPAPVARSRACGVRAPPSKAARSRARSTPAQSQMRTQFIA